MHPATRRQFLEESMIATAAAAAAAACSPASDADETPRRGPQDIIRHAVIGCRIRGRVHASEFAKQNGVEVVYVCDPDQQLAEQLADQVEKQHGKRPKAVQDLRTIMDDTNVDTVSIAAPNHWHALAAVWAMQSGKDVYVEKPVSNTIQEGRLMVQVARKTGRLCQAGTQNRSVGANAAAADYVRAGKLGDVTLARTIIYGGRGSIGARGTYQVPEHVDYNLWLGPGTQETLTRPQLHYDWHWVWDTGNGELGNNNIHYIDLVRWVMGLKGPGDAVMSVGGRLGYQDAGETPNTQMVVHQFGPATVIQEVRGLKTEPFSDKFSSGWVIHGTEGFIAGSSLFDTEGNLVQTFSGPSENHFANFIKAVRNGQREQLKAEIEEGHQSTALCHVGNISHRLGQAAASAEIEQQVSSYRLHPQVTATLSRMIGHLRQNGVDLDKNQLTLGPLLKLQTDQEKFQDNAAANNLLTREYRRPFLLPDVTNA